MRFQSSTGFGPLVAPLLGNLVLACIADPPPVLINEMLEQIGTGKVAPRAFDLRHCSRICQPSLHPHKNDEITEE